MAMHESEYYENIGEWLIQKKGCQKNEYSKGYAKEVELSGGTRVDVFGLKYILHDENDSYNSFKFVGYAVEVKHTPLGAVDDIGKITRIYLPKMREASPKQLINGLHTINYYIAFKGDSTPQDLLTQCRDAGVGILRLHENGEDHIDIKEELEPEEHSLGGISNKDQQSPGIFGQALRDTICIHRVIENPGKLFEERLRPKSREYKKELALCHARYCYIKKKEAEEALDYIFEQVITDNPNVIAEGRGKRDQENIIVITSCKSGEPVLKFELTTKYFYIDTMDGKQYRVISKNEVLGFLEDSTTYTIDLPKLVETEIEPRLKA